MSLFIPNSRQYLDELSEYEELYEKIRDSMRANAYGSWESCVNEHIVRATTILLVSIYQGKEAAKKLMKSEKKRGFIYLEDLCKSLVVYEQNWDQYLSFDCNYPELLHVFKNLSKK